MTIAWSGFPASVAATASDVVVGLAGGTANARFNANSWLFAADNLSDLADAPTARHNLGLGSTDTVAFGLTSATSSTASATPGTIRALIGSMTGSNAVMTSGNLVGARGAATVVGASGGFIYGVQGKVISTGTLSGSSWTAGVFGQLDISAATINAGQVAAIWGDYGTSSGTLTNQTGLYGIAMTNTTAAVLQGQLYLYGGAQNLMLLNTNSGLSGVTYFKNAGTSAGSWGNAAFPTVSKVLKLNIDGTDYYLPVVAQNS